jgi:SAM-dependent methyltransferase
MNGPEPTQAQRAYYAQTASHFDEWHLHTDDEHQTSLKWIDVLFSDETLPSILDVGSGTGRALMFFGGGRRFVVGAEPSYGQIAQAVKNGIPANRIVQASGYDLPFADQSFDAVVECGMLHHVKKPQRVIQEMFRVARKAVFISDSNRFGEGKARYLKVVLGRLGLWPIVEFLKTGGRGYHFSEKDGHFYSFSVYDHLDQIRALAERVWILPVTATHRRSWFYPLLTHGHVLVCAFKEGFGPAPGQRRS